MGSKPHRSRGQLVLASLILFVLKCVSNAQAEVNKAFDNPFTLNDVDSETETVTDSPEEYLNKASDVLAKLLLIPWPKGGSPLLYVEKPGVVQEYLMENAAYHNLHENDLESEDGFRPTGSKRSKYYRKYPWKRQQNSIRIPDELDNDSFYEIRLADTPKRSKYYRKCPWKRHTRINRRYEPAYMCLPNKDDVYRLLVAIHGERDGYKGQLVDFCNRKRPASLVFTNIRYVG